MSAEKTDATHVETKYYAPSPEHFEQDAIDPIAEKKLVRLLDRRIVPLLFGLWLLCFIDRSNIGNARIDGLATDLKLKGLEFNIALAIFYPPYIAVEIPSNWIMKKLNAGIFLPGLMIGWGIVGTLMGLVRTYKALLITRFFLGLMEGGLLGGMVLYLSMFYKRHELLYRLGVFYTAAPLSGAFGGLLAAGLASIRVPGIPRWTWIFEIEGIITVLFGILAAFYMPSTTGTAWFLNEEERKIATRRLEIDMGASADDNDQFSWLSVRRAVFNWNLILTSAIFFCLITPIYSFSLFLPTIINALGYKALTAQLFTVPPYVAGAISVFTTAHFSDKLKMRGPFIAFLTPIGIIGYGLLLSDSAPGVKYAGTFLAAIGIFPCSPCVMAWLANNLSPHYTRATGTGLQLAIANCAAFLATFTYLPKDGPKYKIGHTINIVCLVTGFSLSVITILYCKWENALRARGGRDHRIGDPKEYGYRKPTFRYTL